MRLASSPDPELAQSGQGRLFVSAVIDHRGHVDSSITLGLAISPLGRDSVVARNERTVGWTRFDALPAGMWRVQPYRYFFAELTPFVVESRAGYADSVRVAFRFTKVVYVACRARRST